MTLIHTLQRTVLAMSLLIANIAAHAQAGAFDPTFNPSDTSGTGANNETDAVALQPDGKVVVGGAFTSFNGVGRNHIARLHEDGSIDLSFDPGTGFQGQRVESITLQPDGGLIVGGEFTGFNDSPAPYLVALNSDGSRNNAFDVGTGPSGSVLASVVLEDGRILIAGNFYFVNGVETGEVARLEANGDLDPSFQLFDPDLFGTAYDLAVQPDGKILAGFSGGFVRLNSDGSLDTSFGTNGQVAGAGTVSNVALQPDGKMIITGIFTDVGGIPRSGIARLDANGALDLAFDPGAGFDSFWDFTPIALAPDGRAIIGGGFSTCDGIPRNGIVRLNTDGSVDASFDPGTGFNNFPYVNALALRPDGKIIVVGFFTAYNGIGCNRIVRLLDPCPVGTSCDDGDPYTIHDVVTVSCTCAGTPFVTIQINTDGDGEQTSWEILPSGGGAPLCSGTGYADNASITETCALPAGCYRLRVYDSGGDGISGGGYVLRDAYGNRIIDANGSFGAESSLPQDFCLPLGPATVKANWCDRTTFVRSDFIYCYGVSGASGYQWWFFDPHGSYSRTIFIAGSTGMRFKQIVTDPIPLGLDLNVRVRAKVGGVYQSFGPACRLRVNAGGAFSEADQRMSEVENGPALILYPNPSHHEAVHLVLDGLADGPAPVTIEVFDVFGNMVYVERSTIGEEGSDHVMELPADLAEGMYVVNVTVGDRVYTRRLIRQ